MPTLVQSTVEAIRSKPAPFPARPAEIERLLGLAEAARVRHADRARRDGPRFPARRAQAIATFTHPGGTVHTCAVVLENISSQGLGIIHAAFLHPGTRCDLIVPGVDGEGIRASGQIAWVRHLSGRFHALGVNLDAKIDPRRLVDHQTWMRHSQQPDVGDLSACSGAALCIDPEPLDRELLKMLLQGTGLKVTDVADPGAGFDQFRKRPFDIVFCDLGSGERSAVGCIRRFRDLGYGGPFVVLTHDADPAATDPAREAGACEIIVKPYRRDTLLAAVRTAMTDHFDRWGGSKPIVSDLPDPAAEPVRRFITEVHRQTIALDRAIRVQDEQAVRGICTLLRGAGAGYGFEILSDVSTEALRALDTMGGVLPARQFIARVIQVSRRLSLPA